MKLFFFGTLMDPDVLALVAGRRVPDCDCRSAYLAGYQRFTVRDEHYPVLVADPGTSINGLVVENLSGEEIDRIQFFEASEFELVEQTVRYKDSSETTTAHLFVATGTQLAGNRIWVLSNWQSQAKADFLKLTEDWMAGYRKSPITLLEYNWQNTKQPKTPR